ncbi:hypothetical protein [Algoriphagus boritolerans]|uniref:Uncharacterized protein n=1 Tax=Algoriphagus boritolerans DSM 17298 = JCM 18970 TaxID=1120964 RepID=A0A1H5Y4K7_9BACT|nr:hypothetical protein [Algoriphagus boritolerans]SEG18931.1 hypothetical protein SAMN03080598_02810 [Algoriphagus boritolerans DSM 17298 = JCM 18970]
MWQRKTKGFLKGCASRKLPVEVFGEEPECRGGRKGGWAVAQSPILITTITLSRLRRKGYESMLSYYLKTQPTIQRNAVYSQSRFVGKTRTYGGVRGAPRQLNGWRGRLLD